MSQIRYHGRTMKLEMNNRSAQELDLEIEIVQLSIYIDIIKRILLGHKGLSIVKIVIISFVIKRQELSERIFDGRNRSDLILKFLSQATGVFDVFCEQLPYIIKSIDILVNSKFCEVHEGELICLATEQIQKFDSFTESAIQESKTYTDRQFLREAIRIV